MGTTKKRMTVLLAAALSMSAFLSSTPAFAEATNTGRTICTRNQVGMLSFTAGDSGSAKAPGSGKIEYWISYNNKVETYASNRQTGGDWYVKATRVISYAKGWCGNGTIN